MKKIIATCSFLALLFVNFSAAATVSQQYSKIDDLVKTYPKSFSSPEKLAQKINTDFTSEEEKVRAIFTWIGLNIRYDLNAANSNSGVIAYSYSSEQDRQMKELQIRRKFADKALRSGKGVCQDYSSLFHILCDLTHIKCMDITGTSKAHPVNIGKLPQGSDHQWNTVKIGNEWKLIDVTWASGSVSTETGKFVPEFNDAYFFTAPDVFFLNHFPDDKRFLMTDKSEQDFAQLPLFYGPYIKSDYEIAVPEKGVISNSKSNVIPFRIIDFPKTGRISYVFTNDGKVHDVAPRKNGNISEFEIATTSRTRGFLTIFVDRNAVATYKIEK
jgi:hypothetical protein